MSHGEILEHEQHAAPTREVVAYCTAIAACLVLYVVGLTVLEWIWAGLLAGIGALAVSTLAFVRTRFGTTSAGALGMSVGVVLVNAWILRPSTDDPPEVTVPLVLGFFAGLLGLVAGAAIAELWQD